MDYRDLKDALPLDVGNDVTLAEKGNWYYIIDNELGIIIQKTQNAQLAATIFKQLEEESNRRELIKLGDLQRERIAEIQVQNEKFLREKGWI